MKLSVVILSLLGFSIQAFGQNTDLPGPVPNLQTLPAGSYVIPMDNTSQLNSSGDFNLKSYGLIVHLLNNTVRVRWVIKAGKAKDGIDFSGSAEAIKPSFISASTKDFKAGPFVVFASDTTGIAALIDAFYTSNSLTGSNRPQVYRMTADVANVDIRYDLWGFRPKAAVLTDGGNQNIHIAYMTAASIPTTNYTTSAGTDLLSNCFTFASEPHNTNTGTTVNNAISAIKDFVSKGGNFLAQCEAINNYENNTLGRFQSTGGLTISNTNIGTSITYSNPDLSFSQYEGSYNASSGGSLKNWKFTGSTTNNEHDHATGTGTNTAVIGASVSKHYSLKGGLVFYVGNHSFSTSTSVGINGIRMYMNAFLTPSNTNCPSLVFGVLPLRLLSFSGVAQSGRMFFNWVVAENGMARSFTIETSSDGNNFVPAADIPAKNDKGQTDYSYSGLAASQSYYRLKYFDKQNRSYYSATIKIRNEPNQNQLILLNNPFIEDLMIRYQSLSNGSVHLEIRQESGNLVYSCSESCIEGYNIYSIPSDRFKSVGLYFLTLRDERGSITHSKALRLP